MITEVPHPLICILTCENPFLAGSADGPEELARLEHPKVVNSAYFSPNTGRKLMTTCIDNRHAPKK